MKIPKNEPEIIKLSQSDGSFKISRPMKVRKLHVTFFKVKPNHEFEEPLQNFFKKKRQHDRLTELSALHDLEEYAFYEMLRTGAKLRLVQGYRLKANWKTFRKAFSEPLSPRIRRKIYERTPQPPGHPLWLDVILPNGSMLQCQPRSATQSYFQENKELEAFANRVRRNEL